MLTRGTYVIMNDTDCPEGMLVAVLTWYDDKRGIWHALYLASATNMAAPYGMMPTPLDRFAQRVKWGPDFKTYRVVPTNAPVTAEYKDGKPRAWQDRKGGAERWWTARKSAANACSKFAAPLRRKKESPDMALTDTEHIAVQDMVEEIDAIMRNAREGNSHRGEVLAELAGRVMGLYIAQGRRFGVGDDRVMIDDVTKRAVAFANSAAQL